MYIYFVGIKGVGMASLAVIAKQAGFEVCGSDIADEFITDKILQKEKIFFKTGFSSDNIERFLKGHLRDEVLVVSSAANGGFGNEECVWARENGFRIISHGQAVGEFMSGEIFGKKFKGVSVSGAHGKTTITALISTLLTLLDLDPSYTVGTSEIFPLGAGGHFGKGEYFIAEADEYLSEIKEDRKPKFLYQNPEVLIVNNIDFDHPDFYHNLDEVENAYLDFANQLGKNTLLIVNGDDERVRKIAEKAKKRMITYGVHASNNLVLSDFREFGLSSSFNVSFDKTDLGRFDLSLPGFHNAKNSLCAIAFLMEIGIPISKIREVMPKFLGTKRRLEMVGETKNGLKIMDDYAHHPEEIRKSLNALKEAFPDRKIITIFQPHTYSRTKSLLSEFIASFIDTNKLILLPTFASKRESSNSIMDEEILLEFNKIKKNVIGIEKFDNVIKYVQQNVNDKDHLVLTMGAGDVYEIGYQILKHDK